MPEAGEKVEEGLALLPHLGQRDPKDNGEEDQSKDVRAICPFT